MIRYLAVAALLLLSAPFWLPRALGGDMSYHFVLTPSMKGTLNPGTFVVLRKAPQYKIGDIVGYTLALGDGKKAVILHRIVAELPNGKLLAKGDAAATGEDVEPRDITGKLAFGIPALGFVAGTFRQAPILFGALLVALMFGMDRSSREGARKSRAGPGLFIPTALLAAVSFPFAGGGLAAFLGPMPAVLLLFTLLIAVRFAEVGGVDFGGPQWADAGYMLVMVLAVSTVSLPKVIHFFRVDLL